MSGPFLFAGVNTCSTDCKDAADVLLIATTKVKGFKS